MGMGQDGFFTGFMVIFVIFFVVIAGGIAFAVAKGIGEWSRNNNSPLTTVPATVIAKRTHRTSGTPDHPGSTSYFVSFQVQGGERMELPMSGPQFGVLLEHDRGQLTHQGTRYKGFAPIPRDV